MQIGQGKDEYPKTPTLREWAKNRDAFPQRAYITTMFLPGKVNVVSFVTDAGFRCNIRESSSLYGVCLQTWEEWSNQDCCLYVQLDNAKTGDFTLCIDDAKITRWDTKDWGMIARKGELAIKPPTKRASKQQRAGEE